VEFQPPPNGSIPASNGSRANTGEWPPVPPAPTPVKPASSVTLDPPLIRATVRASRSQGTGDEPTMAFPVSPPAAAVGSAAASPAPTASGWAMLGLRPAARREPADDLVWQSRFAQVTAGVIGGALLLLTLPLWIVLFRLTGPAANNGAGPQVRSLVALSMLLLGIMLAGAATWMIIVEMRVRARMVDALARGRQPGPYPSLAGFDAAQLDPTPFDPAQLGPGPDEANQPVTAPLPMRIPTVAPLGPLSGTLRTFGQLPAQVAVLAVAGALFLGATVLSL
jgi:hypothetical protein